jgi:N-acetylneuraminate synthase|tara:strand:- start:4875 stop:6419 length:1545 start_codon:yes stop_codon:yes gene_type:complete
MNTQKGKFNFDGFIILEMANNHQGSVEHGKKIIETFTPIIENAGMTGAIKFQMRDIDTFIHPDFWSSTEYKHIPRFIETALNKDQFQELVKDVRDAGLYTMITPTDETSVDIIDEIGIDVIKVASCSAADWPLLERIVATGKPVVASTGGLSIEQVDNLVSFFKHRGIEFALMHCVSLYPTPDHKLNLDRIRILDERYPDITIGFSTHENPNNIDAIKIAYAKGARLFERHIGVETDSIKLNAYSSNSKQFENWLNSYHSAVGMTGFDKLSLTKGDENEKEELRLQMRGVYAKNDIKQGDVINKDNIFFSIPLQEGQICSGNFREGLVADRNYSTRDALDVKIVQHSSTRKQIVYKAIHDIKGILNTAKVFVNNDSSVTLLHPDGIDNFFEKGLFVIECIRKHFTKRILVLLSGQSYPKHYHTRREKILQVLSGVLNISMDKHSRILYPGDTILVPAGSWHEFHPSKSAVVEEISEVDESNEIKYVNKDFNKKNSKGKETRLIHWGRHQFDAEP